MKVNRDPLYAALEPLIAAMGYSLLEVNTVHLKEGRKVYLVVYSAQGISMKDCTEINRTVLPKLEIILDARDISLEVSSPGLERKLSSFEEFALFQGKKARVLIKDEGWIFGIITEADQKSLVFNVEGVEGNDMRELTRDLVYKAQLVYQRGDNDR